MTAHGSWRDVYLFCRDEPWFVILFGVGVTMVTLGVVL